MKMASKVLLLVVEDEQALAQMYSDRFKLAGFDVDVAREGEEAINKMVVEHPDIVLMDILMPGLSGTEAVERAKANPATRNIPIVMLTNFSDSIELRNAMQQGAIDYIVKPEATPSQVADKVRKILTPGSKQ